jgi:uncharacterized protein (DUF58 family)
MNRLPLRLLCRIYLLLVLLAASSFAAAPYSRLSLALLLVVLFVTIRPLPPRTNAAVSVAVIFLTPPLLAPWLERLMPLAPTAAQIISVVLVMPVIYLLDDSLRQHTRLTPAFMEGKPGWHITYTAASLFVSALVIMLLSPVLGNPVLLFTGIAFALYLLGVLTGLFLTIPRPPLATPTTGKRVIAGAAGSIPIRITSRASAKLHSHLSPSDPWVKVTPRRFILNRGETRLALSFTPPLAGQTCPQLRISAIDPRGFIQINQQLEPLRLHVIPRAKYAEWLARKYLEQTGTGVVTDAASSRAPLLAKQGAEYLESRTYQPGDQLKDIDWKHTAKLSQLIVKEYTEAGERAAIIAVNLSVTDAGEADKLAFNLITVALTLARENIPAALAAYNHRSVVLSTGISDPAAILRQAMSLVKEITVVEFADRHLEPADIARIRRNITRLKQAESEPARRLLGMLDFEYRAIEEAARNHPATSALSAVTREAPSPAMIFLVSQLNHDAEAIMVTAEKLAKRRFTTIPVEAAI